MRQICIALLATAMLCATDIADARGLHLIQASGTLGLCAHPNSLPFANKGGDPPGFQIELGQVLARELGVTLVPEWIVVPFQISRADCDIVLDVIAEAEARPEGGLRVSRPYYRSGIGLAVPSGSRVTSFAALNSHTKVGVLVSSLTAMVLGQRGVGLSIFGFDDEMLEAVAEHQIDAAAITPILVAYYNHRHPEQPLGYVPPDPAEPQLRWNVGVGMRRSDPALRDAIDAAVEKLSRDGIIARIYQGYGVTLQAPQ